ncbi:13021_t:CDS:2, partial [Dentiscutata erythropus]
INLEHSDCSIYVTIFLPDTITVFESDTEQQFYQSAKVLENIINVHFPILTTESSFSSNKDQPQDNIFTAEVDSWNPATGPQFRQVLLLKDTILQLPGGFPGQQTWDHNQSRPTSPTGSDRTQVHTIDYTTLFANNEFVGII